ncbi:hypothetical protein P4669_05160, partial [Priestia megaterium]|nr:hypothetical protein [Priestia megaterium]
MTNNQERINLQQGRPHQEEIRDHVPFKANLGMIDRWLMGREGKQTKVAEKTTQITSSNHKKIDIGEKVTLSAPIWKTYTILSALVDSRTFSIKRGFKKQIAEDYLGMTVRAFQQHLNVLYEIGLLEFYEKQLKGETVTDISVYPYPHYADTPACYLVRFRNVEDREGKGLEKSKRANEARIEKLLLAKEAEEAAAEVEKKSSQPKKTDLEKKSSQGVEKKSSQGVEKKSSQGVEKKSSHTKVIMIQSNNVQNN